MLECPEPGCARQLENAQGVQVHVARKHPELSARLKEQNRLNKAAAKRRPPIASQPTTTNTDSGQLANTRPEQSASQPPAATANTQDSTPRVKCTECGQQFATQRGLVSHMASHPAASNRVRLAGLQAGLQPEHDEPPREAVTQEETEIARQCEEWLREFKMIAATPTDEMRERFEGKIDEFLKFLHEAPNKLPGPKHPASIYHEKRKKRKSTVQAAQQSRSSNPQRTDKRKRQRRKDDYDYKLAQHEFKYQRRRVVRRVLNEKAPEPCPIPIDKLKEHFESIFAVPNDRVLASYPTYEKHEDISVTLEEVNAAIKSIRLDTSPGDDRVLIRTIRDLNVGAVLREIIEIMLATSWTPKRLSEGRTVLIPKEGDPNDPNNYRPITIYSIIRRIIERVLDKKLRAQIELECNQRGFVSVPGTHVNSRLVNECLLDAKQKKAGCAVVFLDISKAFDGIGHRHVERSLEAYGVSSNLRRLIVSLLTNNTIQISVGGKRSERIAIRRSVPQGGPLSPLLFNLASDYVLRDACEESFANEFGYRLRQHLRALSLISFADDQAILAVTPENAMRIAELVHDRFSEIGLTVNPRKSTAICVRNGRLSQEELKLYGETIRCLQPNERIKYLGCTFTDELIFDPEIVVRLGQQMTNLLESPLLQRDQKLTVLNQYLLPKVTYPLQAAPVNRIPKQHLDTLDRTIRQTAKGIVGLPIHNTPNAMLYAARKDRGLGLICAKDEVQIQHFAIAEKLERVDDDLFQEMFDGEEEKSRCKEELGVEGDEHRQLRSAVRDRYFASWSAMDYAGVGVRHFRNYPKANRFVSDKKGLSGSEWVAAIKISVNYANLAGVPGNSQSSSRRCRRCASEIESTAHVLGACEFGLNRRNARHHRVKHALAELLRAKGLQTFDEVPCQDGFGSVRRIDILAVDERRKMAYLIDPTVRFETNADVDRAVQEEKKSIYESCVPDLKQRFGHEDFSYEVIGVWFGARGAIGESALNLFNRFGLPMARISEIAVGVISDSVKIIHHHVYAS